MNEMGRRKRLKLPSLPVSRRQFLIGSAAMPMSGVALANGFGEDTEIDIEFTWSADRSEMTVAVVLDGITDGRLDNEPRHGPSWTLRRRAFGPDADFVLSARPQASNLKGYELRVVNAQFGRLRGRSLHFIFSQHRLDERNRFVFGVHMVTDLISIEGAPSQGGFVGFGDPGREGLPVFPYSQYAGHRPVRPLWVQAFFDDSPLETAVSTRRAAGTLAQIFNGIVQFPGAAATWPGGAHHSMAVVFDLSHALKFEFSGLAAGAAPFAVRPEIVGASLDVFWAERGNELEPMPIGAPDAVLDGLVQAEVAGKFKLAQSQEPTPIRIEPADGPMLDLTLKPRSDEENQQIVLRSYISDAEGQVLPVGQRFVAEAVLSADWTMHLGDGGETGERFGPVPEIFGRLYARSLSSIEADNRVRFVSAGQIIFQGQLGPAASDGIGTAAFQADSPIGSLCLTPQQDQEDLRETFARNPYSSEFGAPIQAAFRWDRGWHETRHRPRCEWVDIHAALIEIDAGLRGADVSRLTFEPSELRVFYSPDELEHPTRGSVIRLAAPDGALRAQIDMTRATLRAAKSANLVELQFSFSDMMLQFADGTPELVSANDSCFVAPTQADGSVGPTPDSRPVLVVQFPPQHMFEEALFLPRQPELPDVRLGAGEGELVYRFNTQTGALEEADRLLSGAIVVEGCDIFFDPNNRAHVGEVLALLMTEAQEILFRRKLCEEKIAAEPSDGGRPFRRLALAFGRRASGLTNFPAAQHYYIGPYALDIDGMHLARRIECERIRAEGSVLRDSLLAQVADARGNMEAPPYPGDLQAALLREAQLEAAVPSYQLYRSLYREQMIEEATTGGPANVSGPQSLDAADIEFIGLAPGGGAAPTWAVNASITVAMLRARKGRVDDLFVRRVLAPVAEELLEGDGPDNPPRLMEGRLSNPSRIAFRVPCRDGIEAARLEVAGLGAPDDQRLQLPRDRFEFTLDSLTNFAAFELSVVRRAELVFEPDGLGRRAGFDRRLDPTARGRLAHLGFQSGGFLTSAQRLADVQASLTAPTPYQTAIEIPSRLTLSPHQRAVFLTPHAAEEAIFDLDPQSTRRVERLWSAELDTSGFDPGVRAVHSPDLRPGFVWQRLHRMSGPQLPGGAAPPRGPVAPWRLDPTDTGLTLPGPAAIAQTYWDNTNNDPEATFPGGPPVSDAAFCATLDELQDGNASTSPFPGVVSYLCNLLGSRQDGQTPNPRTQFRSTLDAYARHELVLLSSCWGLPVLGRRDAAGNLTADSSQLEVADADQLMDVAPGSALYQPQTLGVTELSLTALGGTLRQDTSFQPPASAKFLDQSNLFDAMSVERWQHWTVLGRDIFSEVVYKGFLVPFGHRASLVQVTQREFLSNYQGGIWAVLRQRMFIRIGQPEKRFPAIDQPFQGRAFPLDNVTFLTTQSPDIVDPFDPASGGDSTGEDDKATPLASGRVDLGDKPGLAFWPRTAPTDDASVRFEVSLNNHRADLPILFIDNVAANDSGSMERIADYYNALSSPDNFTGGMVGDSERFVPRKHWRTLATGGQKYRYAPELEAGSASQETDHWTLQITGRQVSTWDEAENQKFSTVTARLNNFEFDALLNGADQPPFYPLVQVARIRARQAERLAARSLGSLRARFDGDYLRYGLPADPNEAGEHPASIVNTSGVYLALLDMPDLSMGNKGDRSGGIVRPSGFVAALSRAKGIHTFDTKIALETDAWPRAGALYSPESGVTFTSPEPDTAPATPATATTASRSSNPTAKLRDIYQKLFSDDAKLLGLVKLKEIMKFLEASNLDDPEKGMPELAERIRFGAQAVSSAQEEVGDAIGDGIDLVRTNVLQPLDQGLTAIRESWQAIEEDIAGLQDGSPGPNLSLAMALPELDQGLDGLAAAVDASLAETDPIAFALSLGSVYEAGRRFIDALAAAAANPLERVTASLSEQYKEILGAFDNIENVLINFLVENILNEVEFQGDEFAETAARVLAEWFPVDDIIPLPPFAPSPAGSEQTRIDLIALLRRQLNEKVAVFMEAFLRHMLAREVFVNDADMLETLPAIRAKLDRRFKTFLLTPMTIEEEGQIPAIWLIEQLPGISEIQAELMGISDWIAQTQQEAETFIIRLLQLKAMIEAQQDQFIDLAGDALEGKIIELLNTVLAPVQEYLIEAILSDRLRQIFDALDAITEAYGRAANENASLADRARAAIDLLEVFIGPIGLDPTDPAFIGPIDLDPNNLCDALQPGLDLIKPYLDALKLSELALAGPTMMNRLVLVPDEGEIAVEDAPEERDPPVPVRQEYLATLIYAAHADLSALIVDMPAIREVISNETSGDVQAGLLESYDTAEEVLKSWRGATAQLYAQLANDAILLKRAEERIERVANLLGCTSVDPTDVDIVIEAVANLPADLEAVLRLREAMLHAALNLVRDIVNGAAKLAEDRYLSIGLGLGVGLGLWDSLRPDAGNGPVDRISAAVQALDEKARDFDHKLALALARNALEIVTAAQSFAGRMSTAVEGWFGTTAAETLSAFIDLDALRQKLNALQLESVLGVLGRLESNLSAFIIRFAGTPSGENDRWLLQEFIERIRDDADLTAIENVWRNVPLRGGPKIDRIVEADILPNNWVAQNARAFDLAHRYAAELFSARALDQEEAAESIEAELRAYVRSAFRRLETAALSALDGHVHRLFLERRIPNPVSNMPRQLTFGEFYQTVLLNPRNALLEEISGTPAAAFLATFRRDVLLAPADGLMALPGGLYTPGDSNNLMQSDDGLAGETAWLTYLARAEPPMGVASPDPRKPLTDAESRAFLKLFIERWRSGAASPVVIANQALMLVSDILSGEFLTAIDFNEVRDRIEEYLLGLIPQEITMGYNHSIALTKSVEAATQGIFVPADGSALTVGATITLKLNPSDLNADVQFTSRGELGPFSVKLVGNFIDAVEIKFTGASFSSSSNGETEFDAEFSDAIIGRDLQFVQKFQKYLSPKPGSGLFLNLSFAPLGIEAGYQLSLGTFSVGAMSIFNVGLRASALLPFENAPALFKAGLSSRQSPFTISYLPYGGSGFFSITANPDGIVGFEASFEFGGAAAFGFGPLSGQGRLMVGVYIRQLQVSGRSLTEISGTFFAGGSASLWIFSFGASLYVRMGMVNGNMSGEATFTFSFSMGLKDFEFSVQVWKQEGEGFAGDGQQASLSPANLFRRFAEFGSVPTPGMPLPSRVPQLRSFGTCQGENWNTYQSYFDRPDPEGPLKGVFQ